jgi:CubicO group peptidase (beta-lactamase class C family)
MRPSESVSFGHPSAFGAPGTGGSIGYADPEVGVGYGYVTNRMRLDIQGDPRDLALRDALDRALCRG